MAVRVNYHRMSPEGATKLVEEGWAPHEVKMYKAVKARPASPPDWKGEVLEYPDLGPSDCQYATQNKLRPNKEIRDPAKELEEINASLANDTFRISPAEGEVGNLDNPTIPEALISLWKRSEMRTPLVVPLSISGLGGKDEVINHIKIMAINRRTRALPLHIDSEDREAEALIHLQTGLENGCYVILVQEKEINHDMYREVARKVVTVMPDPECYPKQELFRLWVLIDEPFDPNETCRPYFPVLFTHSCLQLCEMQTTPAACKVIRTLPADPYQLQREVQHRQKRCIEGREFDAESIEGDALLNSCSSRKVTGPLFVRSCEMFEATSPMRSRERMQFSGELEARVLHENSSMSSATHSQQG